MPGTQALSYVFERKNIDTYSWANMAFVLTWRDLPEYLIDHGEATTALLGTLSAGGRTLLAQTLGGTPLLQTFPELVVRLAIDGSKGVRATASAILNQVPESSRLKLLEHYLRNGNTTEREQAVELLGQKAGKASIDLLTSAQEEESSKTVLQAIRNAISRLDAAHDARDVEMPPAPPFAKIPDSKLGDDVLQLLMKNHEELLETLKRAAEQEKIENSTHKNNYRWRQDHYKEHANFSAGDIRNSLELLNGEGPKKRSLTRAQLDTLSHGGRLQAHPEFRLPHLVRWIGANNRKEIWRLWFDDRFQHWVSNHSSGLDLRSLADVLERTGYPVKVIANDCLQSSWQGGEPQDVLPPEHVWPFFAEHLEFLEEGLGLRPNSQEQYREYTVGNTLGVLATFPVIPPQFIPRVMELALGEGKTNRPAAQAVMSKVPDMGGRVVESLGSSKMEIRIVAAEWLANLEHREAVPALYKALKKESRETARAIMLTVLERLGEDISSQLAPDILQKEAEKGLAAKVPSWPCMVSPGFFT